MALMAVTPAVAQEPSQTAGTRGPFVLPYRAADTMAPEDQALWHSRQKDLIRAAAIHGYNLDAKDVSGAGAWSVQESGCPLIAGALLLRYQQQHPDGSESAFAAVVPRNGDPVRVVAAVHHSTLNFTPSYESPETYTLFNGLVSPQTVGVETSWLTLGACYADVSGQQVAMSQNGDHANILTPGPQLQVDLVRDKRAIGFAQPDGSHSYKIWTISLNEKGNATRVRKEGHSVDTLHGLHPSEPTAKLLQPNEQPPVKPFPDVIP
ncbi:hypothetical protein [Silvibacterium sp.]|uniref:hypothetical protein n=1 Tax=Silvibacterium sp. TaxID=1964179 RepID=UPI0039E5E57E